LSILNTNAGPREIWFRQVSLYSWHQFYRWRKPLYTKNTSDTYTHHDDIQVFLNWDLIKYSHLCMMGISFYRDSVSQQFLSYDCKKFVVIYIMLWVCCRFVDNGFCTITFKKQCGPNSGASSTYTICPAQKWACSCQLG